MIVATKLVCVTLIALELFITNLIMQKQTFSKSYVSINDKLGC